MRFVVPILLVTAFGASARAAEPPKAADLKKGIPFGGRTEATVVEVRPRVSGLLTRILVKEGEAVRKGDVLAEIDDRVFKAKLAVAQAELTVAQAQEKVAAAETANVKALFAQKVVGKGELEKAEAGLATAKARVEAAKAT